MEQEDKDSKTAKKKVSTLVLGILLSLLIIGLIVSKIDYFSKSPVDYKLGEVAFEFPETRALYTGVNKDQIIRVTKDGVTAYDIKGQEIWMDTLTLNQLIVKQKEPYFAIGSMKERKISVFSDKGKEGDILTEAPVLYFSVNEKGDVATIEETKEGHIIGAYDKTGARIHGKRVSYIESAGFPITVEVSPDRTLLLASYLDIYSPVVTTKLVGVFLNVEEEQAVDNIKFGVEEKDNLVYEIEYIDHNRWVAIGDKNITYYDQAGQSLKVLEQNNLKYSPYVHSGLGEKYLPILSNNIQGEKAVYAKQSLSIFDKEGEIVNKQDFEEAITSFYPDEKGIIIGQGKDYKGFDQKGNLRFTFHATQDIEALRYLGRKLIAITKNEVIHLQVSEEGEN